MSATPALSVVVGLISGRKGDLRRCLEALSAQSQALEMEILVPYDEPCAEVVELAGDFPKVRFLLAEGLDTTAARAGMSREHHDTLRTLGIRNASAPVIALTEDHAYGAEGWCVELVEALERFSDAAAVGGAVECDSDRTLNWAIYFCDFGRYQNPLPEGPSEFVSDSNVAYRRSALSSLEGLWADDDYHETAVHWELIERGWELCTTPRVVVWQRRGRLTLAAALRERFVWGRSFAGTRARIEGPVKRALYAALSPLLPLVMTLRVVRTSLSRGRHTSRLVASLPAIALLQSIWALGECVGYLRGRP